MIEITKKDYKKPCERYQSFHKEEKEKAQQCGCEGYKNFPENEKERLVEYRKRCYKMRKKHLTIIIIAYCIKIDRFYVWKIVFFPVIIRNYFCLENFGFFRQAWVSFQESIKKFSFSEKSWGFLGKYIMVGWNYCFFQTGTKNIFV